MVRVVRRSHAEGKIGPRTRRHEGRRRVKARSDAGGKVCNTRRASDIEDWSDLDLRGAREGTSVIRGQGMKRRQGLRGAAGSRMRAVEGQAQRSLLFDGRDHCSEW